MMAEPAAALGIPLRLLAEARGRLGRPGDPRPRGRRLPRPRRAAPRSPRLRGRHLRPRARADRAPRGARRPPASPCRPGPGALVHAQDKAVMRERLGELGVPCPRNAVVASVGRRRGVRLPVRAQDHPRRLRRQGRLVRPRGRATAPSRSPPPRRPAYGCSPRSSSTSGASSRRWWCAARAARPRRTRSWSRCSATASATRWSPRRPTSTRRWPAQAQRLALLVAGELDVTGVLAVELFETHRRPDPRQRARDAPAQHRALDPGRRGHLAVREPPARRARPAAGLARAAGDRGR